MDKIETAVTGEGTAPHSKRPNHIISTIVHEIIRRAFDKSARRHFKISNKDCPAAMALEISGREHGFNFREVHVDRDDIRLIDNDLKLRFVWNTPPKVRVFVDLYDEGKVIDKNGNIHVTEEITFRLKFADAKTFALPEQKERKPRDTERTKKPKSPSTPADQKGVTKNDPANLPEAVFAMKTGEIPGEEQMAKESKPRKQRAPRALIAPSYHRVRGTSGFNRIAETMLTNAESSK